VFRYRQEGFDLPNKKFLEQLVLPLWIKPVEVLQPESKKFPKLRIASENVWIEKEGESHVASEFEKGPNQKVTEFVAQRQRHEPYEHSSSFRQPQCYLSGHIPNFLSAAAFHRTR
jgi:hypothetical protein